MLIKPGAWHFTLLAILLSTNVKPALSSVKEPQVQWNSPSAGDRYSSGDSIVATWSSDSAVVSPAFKLCQGEPQASDQGDNETCGSKVYPTIQQSFGTYSTSLAVPNVTSEEEWYVVMSDDFGNSWSSSSFYLSPEGDSAVVSAANAQAPLLAQPQTPTSTSPVIAAPATALPVPIAVSESASSVATSILATRTPISTAAFAVPLSIVGAILLVAAVLSLRHNRKLAEERAQDVEKLILSRKSSVASSSKSGFSRQSDIEHALNVLSKAQSQGDIKRMPVPLFMPVEIPFQREARRSTRESYHANQYTEYHRPSQRRHQDKPPSYRSAPLSCPSRSQSQTRSLLSSVSSHSQASSRTPVHLPSHHYEDREQSNNRTCENSSHQLTPVQVTSPLHHSEYEYSSVQREGLDNWRSRPRSRYKTYRGVEDADCATDSVLDEYLFIEPAPKPLTFPPGLPKPPQLLSNPPRCLIPAPQRLHVRNSGAVSPMSDNIIEEEEEEMTMEEVNLYDVVADSLNRARRY